MPKYPVRDDYKDLKFSVPMNAFLLPLLQIITRSMFNNQTINSSIKHSKKKIIGYKDDEISIEIFDSIGMNDIAPCILFIHGGAFALPAAGHHKKLICDYVLKASCKIVFVDYRLTPKYPYPYGLEDCYYAYKWILDNANENGFDINKIAVCGDSAGGALAATLTQIIRDRGIKRPLFQMLVYPVMDSRLITESMKKYLDTPIWNAKLTKKMWKLYIANYNESKNYPYASPMAAVSFSDLPKGYIEVNEFDCLRDEAIEYCQKLQCNSIDIVLNQTDGTVHGFELNYESKYTQEIIEKRIEYIKNQFE